MARNGLNGATGATGPTGPAGSAGLLWEGTWTAESYPANSVVYFKGSYVTTSRRDGIGAARVIRGVESGGGGRLDGRDRPCRRDGPGATGCDGTDRSGRLDRRDGCDWCRRGRSDWPSRSCGSYRRDRSNGTCGNEWIERE